MLFYDFEVFKYDWLVVILDMIAREEHVIVNDPEQLKLFYEEHKNDTKTRIHLMGLYHYQGLVVFVEFKLEDYIGYNNQSHLHST